MKAKKKFGQNFLINDTIIYKIISLLNVNDNDLVIEIGPGKGALTKELSQLDSKLLCIEIDTDMKHYLSKYDVIYDDILKINLNDIISKYNYNNLYVIGNLPYYITSPIIEKLIKSNLNIKKMIFMVQKEVADRFTSKSSSKEYGYMTIFINHYYDTTYNFLVKRDNFIPIPKVDSAIISLDNKNIIYNKEDEKYLNFLKQAFSFKRKTLKNNLTNYDFNKINKVLKKYNLNENVRAEQLEEKILIDIYKELYERI